MGKRYANEKHCEALKLADGIGVAAAAQRLGINVDTLYLTAPPLISRYPH